MLAEVQGLAGLAADSGLSRRVALAPRTTALPAGGTRGQIVVIAAENI